MQGMLAELEQMIGVRLVMVPLNIAEDWEILGVIRRGEHGQWEYVPPEEL